MQGGALTPETINIAFADVESGNVPVTPNHREILIQESIPKSNSKTIIITFITIVVVILAGYFGYQYYAQAQAKDSLATFLCSGDIIARTSVALSEAGLTSFMTSRSSDMSGFGQALGNVIQIMPPFIQEISTSSILKSNKSGIKKLADSYRSNKEKILDSIMSVAEKKCKSKLQCIVLNGKKYA